MDIHQNARTTPRSRAELVRRILQPQPVRAVAREFGICERRARKWLGRLQAEGEAGLADRSCRPHRSPRTTPAAVVAQVVTHQEARPDRGDRHRMTGDRRHRARHRLGLCTLTPSSTQASRRLEGSGLATSAAEDGWMGAGSAP
jgi:transposase-like protein